MTLFKNRIRQLKHIRHVKGLERVTTLSDKELDELILAQKEVLGGRMHIRLMTKHLRSFCRVWASRERVQKSLQTVDPAGRHHWPTGPRKRNTRNTAIAEPQPTNANNEAIAAESPFSDTESVDSVESPDGNDDMSMTGMDGYQNDGTETAFADTRSVTQQVARPSIEVTTNHQEPIHTTRQEPIQRLPTELNYHEQEISRLSVDNRSLRAEVASLADENNYLRAEIARLTGNSHPFLHMSHGQGMLFGLGNTAIHH